jgi:hypothetical protein
MAPPPCTIGRSPLHVATPLRPCHAHAAAPLLTIVVTPSPRRTRLYKRPSPLQSSASAVPSFFSCPPWPPVGELLLLVASISFRPRLSLPTSPRSPTEACTTASCRTQHPPRRSLSRGGRGSTPSPSTTTGRSSAATNPRNGTLDEPRPLPLPFPAHPGLPLVGIRPSPPLPATRDHIEICFLSRDLSVRTRDLFAKNQFQI